MNNENIKETQNAPEQFQPRNRKERRLIEKQKKKNDKIRLKRIQKYIERHPESVKINLDEEKIKEVENENTIEEDLAKNIFNNITTENNNEDDNLVVVEEE